MACSYFSLAYVIDIHFHLMLLSRLPIITRLTDYVIQFIIHPKYSHDFKKEKKNMISFTNLYS